MFLQTLLYVPYFFRILIPPPINERFSLFIFNVWLHHWISFFIDSLNKIFYIRYIHNFLLEFFFIKSSQINSFIYSVFTPSWDLVISKSFEVSRCTVCHKYLSFSFTVCLYWTNQCRTINGIYLYGLVSCRTLTDFRADDPN